MIYFTEHRRFEITNIVRSKVLEYRNTAMQVVLHRKLHKKGVDTATPRNPMSLNWKEDKN